MENGSLGAEGVVKRNSEQGNSPVCNKGEGLTHTLGYEGQM
jgi:hypothetical protein